MGRSLSEIYSEARIARDEKLELTEIKNDSKMSVMDMFTWVVAACIWTFENILDVFEIDIAQDINARINGTPSYYANALLKYQTGDTLMMNEEGTIFSYPSIDESKRIITRVSYSEVRETGFYDNKLVFKVAMGSGNTYDRLPEKELLNVKAYLRQLAFAGTHLDVVSRKGDVLMPKVKVFYDGAITGDELYANIESSLQSFIQSISFDGVVYVQKIIDAIAHVEHVVDVLIDPNDPESGIFVAQYDDNDDLSRAERVTRLFTPNSGYVKQSTATGDEKDLPAWKDCITLEIEQ